VNAPSKLIDIDEQLSLFDNHYKLSKDASDILAPFFKTNFFYDVSKVRISFGYTFGQAAYTVDRGITIDWNVWHGLTDRGKMKLLAHEITHVIQYDTMGIRRFLGRYAREYDDSTNYVVPPELESTPIEQVDVLERNYTLDQNAERVADEVGDMLN
jgi:phage major head subunit gpT-like protein